MLTQTCIITVQQPKRFLKTKKNKKQEYERRSFLCEKVSQYQRGFLPGLLSGSLPLCPHTHTVPLHKESLSQSSSAFILTILWLLLLSIPILLYKTYKRERGGVHLPLQVLTCSPALNIWCEIPRTKKESLYRKHINCRIIRICNVRQQKMNKQESESLTVYTLETALLESLACRMPYSHLMTRAFLSMTEMPYGTRSLALDGPSSSSSSSSLTRSSPHSELGVLTLRSLETDTMSELALVKRSTPPIPSTSSGSNPQ